MRRWYRPVLEAEQIDIASRLLQAKQAGKLANVWIDNQVIRVAYRSSKVGLTKRMISWQAAANLVQRLEREGTN